MEFRHFTLHNVMKPLQKLVSVWLLLGHSMPVGAEGLMQLWEHVVENNPVLKGSEYSVEQVRAQQDQVLAKLLPQAAIKGYYSFNSYNRNENGSTGFNLAGGTNQQYGGYNGSFTISQTLFDLPSYLRLQGAQKATEQQEQSALAQRMDIAYKLVDEYLHVLEAEDVIEQIDAELTYAHTQIERLQHMHESQLAKVTDLYEMEAYGQSLETSKIEAEHGRSIALEKVREIAGVTLTSPDVLLQNEFPEVHRSADEWVQEAMSSNPLLLSLQHASESAQNIIQSAHAEHLPTASVSASETVANTVYNNISTSAIYGFTGYNIGSMYLNVNIPIYAGGGVEAGVRESVQKYQVTREKIEEARRAIEKDTRTSWFNAHSGHHKIESTRKEMSFREKAKMAQATSYQIGASTIVDVLDSHRKLLKARADYHKARYDFIRSLIRLRLNSGSLADLDLEAVSAWFGPLTTSNAPTKSSIHLPNASRFGSE